MNTEQQPDSSSDERINKVIRVLEDVTRRRAGGEQVDDRDVVADHPELLPELQKRLRALRVVEQAERAAVAPNVESTETSDAYPPVNVPKIIGHFHIKRLVASGGMGSIFEATQEHPRRVVAIKIMRRGITSRSAMRRFEYESQILARLRHPGIAQVYEAGTYSDGSEEVPYFAMEYIPNARPITEFVKQKKLGLRRRLELFAHACDAVNHGHLKAIIHRDFKPDNILVDSHGEVKIIDFGVARGTDSDMALTTLQTDVGQLIGTLQYMSPEQCEGDPHDIDIRSDVYALGVVLYELLSGKVPYDVSRRKLADSTRIIREQQPTRPSSIDAKLKGDMETIVLKAMEKDRDRRYQSALELAQDIRRHLAGEVIVARPPSMFYQFRVFARRNKGLFASLAAVFALLVTGVAVSTSLYLKAHASETKFKVVNDFLLDEVLALADPEKGRGATITLKEALDNAVGKIDTAFPEHPTLGANIRTAVGRIYLNLGLYAQAEPQLVAALALLRSMEGEDHPDTLEAAYQRASLMWKQGKYAEAESAIRRTLELQRRVLGQEHRDTLGSANMLAITLSAQGKEDEAEALYRSTLEIQHRTLGPEHKGTLSLMNNLAGILSSQGNKKEAIKLWRDVLDIHRRTVGEDHPLAITVMHNLAVELADQGKPAEAERLAKRALENARRVWGPDHPDTLKNTANLAVIAEQRRDVAIDMAREALERQRRLLGEGHPDVIGMTISLAVDLANQGKDAEAEKLGREVLDTARGALGEGHPDVIGMTINLAVALANQGKYAEAEKLARQTLDIASRMLGEEHVTTLAAMRVLGAVLNNQGKYAEAEKLARQALEAARRTLGEEHATTLEAMSDLAYVFADQEKDAEAEKLDRRALAIARRVLGDRNPLTLMLMVNHAEGLVYVGQLDTAEDLAREAYEGLRATLGDTGWLTLYDLNILALAIHRNDRPGEAKPLFEQALEGFQQHHAGDVRTLSEIRLRYGDCIKDLGSYQEAEAQLLGAYEFFNPDKQPHHRLTRETISSLVDLYQKWGKPDQAAEWRAKLPENAEAEPP